MKKVLVSFLFLASFLTLVGCSQNQGEEKAEKEGSKIALVLGFGGVDDRSFNQAGWEGLETWGKDKQLTPKKDFTYNETNNPEDNNTNIDQAIKNSSQRLLV